MGAWGLGPFDSDGALDYLGNVADATGMQTDDYEIVPTKAGQQKATAMFIKTISSFEKNPTEYRYDEIYAIAGVVAAVLVGQTKEQSTGTRLFAKIAGELPTEDIDLGLETNCGYVSLISQKDAQMLRPLARQALSYVVADTEWQSGWVSPSEILAMLKKLGAVLEDPVSV